MKSAEQKYQKLAADENRELGDILQEIKSDDCNIRHTAIRALAKYDNAIVIDTLIDIANGTPRVYRKEKRSVWPYFWKTQDVDVPSQNYDLDDQLEAITALGTTSNEQALEYLRNLLVSKEGHETYQQANTSPFAIFITGKAKKKTFPNAKGELYTALNVRKAYTNHNPYNVREMPEKRSNPVALQTIEQAIEMCEQSLLKN